jgi:hypothetical protein
MQYHLACECGREVAVSEGAAGTTVSCACGRSVQVPSLSKLRLRGPARDEPEAFSGTELSEQEIRSFVGPKADYYLNRWASALEGSRQGTGFNWAAFFLSGLWLPYRKMYLVTFIFYGIIVAESILEDVVFMGILGQPEAPAALSRLVGLIAAIVCGSLGNRWYLSHARAKISELCVQQMPQDEYLRALSKRGGTSLAASFGFFFLFIVVVFLVVVLLELLLAKG